MGKRNIPQTTDVFEYLNINPFDKHTDDCVARALAFALGKSWADVYKDLLEVTLHTGYALGSNECVEKYLKSIGYIKQKQPKKANGTKYTGGEFAKMHKKDTIICKIGSHHISVIKGGKVRDIWNCSECCIGNYWLIEVS